MRPLTIITGIVLGSAFSIAFGLTVVSLIFFILGTDEPRIRTETKSLASSLALFWVLTAVAALSFASALKSHRSRFVLQALMWGGVFLTGAYYWPS